jgi:tRNA nucleotidyltransferase (CCA-adding enzyme)
MDLRQRLQHAIASRTPFGVKDLALDGHDLQRLGMPPGPQMGQMLQRLLHLVLDDPDRNTRDELSAFVQRHMQQQARQPSHLLVPGDGPSGKDAGE